MPELGLMLKAAGAAALSTALVSRLFAWPGKSCNPARATCGNALGLGLGSYLGFLVLGFRPHWPPLEDQDRFLTLVFAAFLGVELLPAIPQFPVL
jgi:hypothetical protein